MPFPLGILAIRHQPRGAVAWAWAWRTNGIFTAVGAARRAPPPGRIRHRLRPLPPPHPSWPRHQSLQPLRLPRATPKLRDPSAAGAAVPSGTGRYIGGGLSGARYGLVTGIRRAGDA